MIPHEYEIIVLEDKRRTLGDRRCRGKVRHERPQRTGQKLEILWNASLIEMWIMIDMILCLAPQQLSRISVRPPNKIRTMNRRNGVLS